MKTLSFLSISILVLFVVACSGGTVKEKINRAGDVAGQTAGELLEGASKGIMKAFDVEVTLSEKLKSKGIELGKSTVDSDSVGTDNLLQQYIIFNQDFSGELTVKVTDKSKEVGRASAFVKGKKNEAKYVDFHFDRRTNIDSKNKLIIE